MPYRHRVLILLLSAKLGLNCDTKEIISLTVGSSTCTLLRMPRIKVKTNVYIDRDLLEKLKKVAAETEVPMARLIRRGIVMVLEDYRKRHRLKKKKS